jgi:hypothetical protein
VPEPPAAPPGPPAERRGVYVLANDRVLDHAIALLASFRARDPLTPVVLIPYGEPAGRAAAVLGERFAVAPFPEPAALEAVDREVARIFGPAFFRRPRNFRKQAAWFGPFERFLYLDADIVAFGRVAEVLDELDTCDFVCCDDQHEGGLRHVFTPAILADRVLGADVAGAVFNGGFWGARRAALAEGELWRAMAEAARHPEHFDFAHGGSDQPILNYVVLSRLARRRNLYRRGGGEPRMWAGTPGFRPVGDLLVDPAVGRPLRFLHWAGLAIGPGYPYWRTWRRYRFRDPGAPRALALPGPPRRRWPRLRRWLARLGP